MCGVFLEQRAYLEQRILRKQKKICVETFEGVPLVLALADEWYKMAREQILNARIDANASVDVPPVATSPGITTTGSDSGATISCHFLSSLQ